MTRRIVFLVGALLAAAALQVSAANLINPEWAGRELHLVDDDAGAGSSNIYWKIFGGDLKNLRGKPLYFAARVKQARAFGKGADIGISISAFRKSGPAVSDGASTGVHGETPWLTLRVKLTVPDDAYAVRVGLRCADGYFSTGEATFRDLTLTTDPGELPPYEIPSVKELGNAGLSLPDSNNTPERAAYRETYRNGAPFKEDGRARPTIKNGTWHFKGRPTFFLGAWIPNSTYRDWDRPGSNPLGIDHVAYTTPPSEKLFAAMGFNSSQIGGAPDRPAVIAALRGMPEVAPRKFGRTLTWQVAEKDMSEYFARFGETPMVMDFGSRFYTWYPKDMRSLLDQCNREWHGFIPFCPEHPEGWAYYRDHFIVGTRAALKNGMNTFLYELFNESSYNCQCAWNRRFFIADVKSRYGTIAAANAAWGTDFDSLRDLVFTDAIRSHPGLRYDWCRFSAKRYADILRRGKETIRGVDRRSNVYFTEQAHGQPPEHPGMDYRLIADALDALTVEGGWRYGFGTVFNAKDEMEEVVATGGSKHFFNLAFFRALAKDCKPISNNEHYCLRLEDGKRVPSHRTDYITSLWLEVMHGVSSSFVFCLDKRCDEARRMKEAYENVVKPSYKSSSLLNPFNVKPEDLVAFKQFREELAPFEDKLLPMPRTRPATVAVYYSYPSMVQSKAFRPKAQRNVDDFTAIASSWYTHLLHRHFPLRVVFDEDLGKLGPEVKALVFPGACEAVPPQAVRDAKAFEARGGLVLAAEGALAFDEYLKPLASVPKFLRVATPEAAADALEARGVPRHAMLSPADGKPLEMSDIQVIDRSGFKFVCCVNMGDRESRRAVMKLFVPERNARFRMSDPVGGKAIGTFTSAELAAGVPVELPPQERVLRVLNELKK